MIKRIISPIQQWLLKRNQCVGCGMPLRLGKKKRYKGSEKVFCRCGRIFIKLKGGGYRRALFEEV
jgi:hypothetical protein